MICKWCGANVDVTKGKCDACGRPLPPVADCGGFYNVVPKAAATPSEEKPEETQPAQGNAQIARKHTPAPARKNRAPWILITVLALVTVIALGSLVAALVLGNRVSKLEEALGQNGETDPEQGDPTTNESRAKDQNNGAEHAATEPTESQGTEQPTITETEPTESTASTVPQPTEPEKTAMDMLKTTPMRFYLENRELTDKKEGDEQIKKPEGAEVTVEDENGKDWTVCRLNGLEAAYLWKARMDSEFSESGIKYTFNCEICDDLQSMYDFDHAEFKWEYYSGGGRMWYPLPDTTSAAPLFPEDLFGSTQKELSAEYELQQQWLEENIKSDAEYKIKCVVTLKTYGNGSITIEYVLPLDIENS